MKKGAILSEIQELQDRAVDRFCAVSRRVSSRTRWMPENTAFPALEAEMRERILFFETRGYYLFQEPVLEHEPLRHRFRLLLTFRPTETNC